MLVWQCGESDWSGVRTAQQRWIAFRVWNGGFLLESNWIQSQGKFHHVEVGWHRQRSGWVDCLVRELDVEQRNESCSFGSALGAPVSCGGVGGCFDCE